MKFKDNALSKSEMRKLRGGGGCGIQILNKESGTTYWQPVDDFNGNGTTKEEAQLHAATTPPSGDLSTTGRWCCDSCPWN